MNNGTSDSVLVTEGLHKRFTKGGRVINVLSGAEIELRPTEIVGILGASGAGKSTFLHIVGGLDEPTTGRVLHGGRDIFDLSETDLATFLIVTHNRDMAAKFHRRFELKNGVLNPEA